MIVCVCRGLAERTILATIARGGDTLERLAAACGAGADCGGCEGVLRALLENVRDADYSGREPRPYLTARGAPCEATSRSSSS
jgi:bacterioferritin-associated ferredoxin